MPADLHRFEQGSDAEAADSGAERLPLIVV
jgi:hypothetical protein